MPRPRRRALLQFDIADNVPAGATITSVKLTLTLGMVAGGGGGSSGSGPSSVISICALDRQLGSRDDRFG